MNVFSREVNRIIEEAQNTEKLLRENWLRELGQLINDPVVKQMAAAASHSSGMIGSIARIFQHVDSIKTMKNNNISTQDTVKAANTIISNFNKTIKTYKIAKTNIGKLEEELHRAGQAYRQALNDQHPSVTEISTETRAIEEVIKDLEEGLDICDQVVTSWKDSAIKFLPELKKLIGTLQETQKNISATASKIDPAEYAENILPETDTQKRPKTKARLQSNPSFATNMNVAINSRSIVALINQCNEIYKFITQETAPQQNISQQNTPAKKRPSFEDYLDDRLEDDKWK